MLGHPTLVARHVGGDAEGETLFTEESVAAITGTEGPDFASLRKVDDVFFLVAGPDDILGSGSQRSANRMHARHDAFSAPVDLGKNRQTDARHDAHIHHDVGRVGDFNADLRDGRTDRPHAERQHIHRAPGHAAVEKPLQLFAHLERLYPIIGRTRAILGERTNESAVFDAGHVARVGTGIITTGPELLV